MFFVTLLTVSLLAGLFLSGAMSAMAMPKLAQTEAGAMDCADHASKTKPAEHKPSGHDSAACCLTGHCPMLAQALMPTEPAPQPSHMGSAVRPVILSLYCGIFDSPHLRPPRHFL
jgi:hypothetical protein